MATIQDILGGGLPAGLLDAEAQVEAERRAQNAGLLNLGFALLQSSRGQPGQGKPTLGQLVGQAGPIGLQAYQQSFDKTLKDTLLGIQLQEARRKQQEAEQLRKLAPQLFQVQREPSPTTGAFDAGQGLDVMQGGAGAVQQPRITGVGVNRQLLPALAALGPTGMEYAKNLVDFERALAPKTSIQTIFDDKGREIKVRYNEESGEFTPIGGAKAEPFTQVDRGNVIELRRPSGELVGTLPKGVAPTAPSYTMTDFGVLNTKTGQLVQPKDDKGNPIVFDAAAKATEGERLSAGFYMRMADATQTINSPLRDAQNRPITDKDGNVITIADAGSKPEIFAEVVGAMIPNWMGGRAFQNMATSSVRQQYEQAQQNWVTANLRKESGAVIGAEEMQNEIAKYFPQVGDSPEKIAQKARSRKVTEEAMRKNAGRALSVAPSQTRNVTVDY